MKSIIQFPTLSILIVSLFIGNTNANIRDFLRNIKKHDVHVAGSAVIVSAITLIPGSLYFANKYHPAALEKCKFEAAKAEQEKKERIAKEEQEKKNRLEAEKTKAQQIILQTRHKYNPEINLLPHDKLQKDKDTFMMIIRSKYNNHTTPFSHYFHILNHDLEKLRTIENILPAEKESERLTLINHLEHILRTHNLVIADSQKIEEELADQKRKKDETEQRKILKEELEIEKYRKEIEHLHTTQTKITHLVQNFEAMRNTVERNHNVQTACSTQIALTVDDVRTRMANYHEENKQLLKKNSNALETAVNRIVKAIEDIKESLKKRLFEWQSQQKNAVSSQPAQQQPNAQYYQQPVTSQTATPATQQSAYYQSPQGNAYYSQPASFDSEAAIQPIPVPTTPSAPPL